MYIKNNHCRRTRGHNLRRRLRKVAVTFVCRPGITVRAIFFALCTHHFVHNHFVIRVTRVKSIEKKYIGKTPFLCGHLLLLLRDDGHDGRGRFGGPGRFGGGQVVDAHPITPGRRSQVRYPSCGPFVFCTRGHTRNTNVYYTYTILFGWRLPGRRRRPGSSCSKPSPRRVARVFI